MERVLTRDVAKHAGQEIMVQGWLHKKRLLGGLNFIVIRDRAGLVQVVVDKDEEIEKLRGMQIGTILSVKGKVVEEPRAPGGAELHEPQITVDVPVTDEPPIEIDKPLSHKPENLDTLFDNRHIGLRSPQEQKIFKIRAALLRYIRDFLYKNDFTEIQTPKLLAGATEGGAEVFKTDYFGKEATLAQSPQLYKQMMVGAFERVFEIAPAFRAELSATTRHMSEVYMLDIEMGFIKNHEEVLDMVQDMTYYTLTNVYKEHADDLKSWNAPALTLKEKFPRYTVAQVHEMYTKATSTDTTKEKDLIPDEEKWICEYAKDNDGSEAVFVTEFPVEAMKFYHKVNPDNPKTVLWADLLFRGLEIATVPLRENNHDKLGRTNEGRWPGSQPSWLQVFLGSYALRLTAPRRSRVRHRPPGRKNRRPKQRQRSHLISPRHKQANPVVTELASDPTVIELHGENGLALKQVSPGSANVLSNKKVKLGILKDSVEIGSLNLRPRNQDEIEVYELWIREDNRRRGYAQAALGILAAPEVLEDFGIVKFSASIPNSNQPARRTFNKAGWRISEIDNGIVVYEKFARTPHPSAPVKVHDREGRQHDPSPRSITWIH